MDRLGRDELDGKTESHQAIPEGQVSRAMETGSLVCILAGGLCCKKIRNHPNLRFSPLFPRRRLPRGGDFENNSDRPMTFNWMEVPQCQEKPVKRMSQASECLAGDF